ncbi:YdeI/OmpD-associated family protein [Polaromonas sp.]|uniref:YdeI/OmpD-associated family protein n=1 Tax=Polaromonas sp. TaxID=1869339 RepID=UPI003CA31E57
MPTSIDKEATLQFALQAEWAQWLAKHHGDSGGIWLRHAKKGAPETTLSHAEALEVALCFGWIDSQRNAENEHFYRQRWSPRGARSVWSKVNRDKVLEYIKSGHMQPSGLAEIERARKDGRWDAAYEPASRAKVPADLQAALDAHPGASAFFATVSAQNRYSVLFRVQGAKKPETRARRIAQFAQMLARGETVYPQGQKKKKA